MTAQVRRSDDAPGDVGWFGGDAFWAGSGLGHPFLRTMDSGLPVGRTWTEAGEPDDPGAPAVVELPGDGPAPLLTSAGEPARLAALLARVASDLEVAPEGVWVSRGTGAYAHETFAAWGLAWFSAWDRMATTSAAGLPAAASGVVRLDPERDGRVIAELLAAANPVTEHAPGRPDHTWYGVRSAEGSLAAVGALTVRGRPGERFGHLGGIGTRPGLRGHGLGTALTARMTADGISRHGLVTLGLYADNDRARRIYERLGFRVFQEVETWRRPV
ncbi:GNAT family N-acetyltransferase [Myceligenerans crystallogenes]